MQKLYELKCCEYEIINDNLKVVRVPGGWIFLSSYNSGSGFCFVPFDNEFDERAKAKTFEIEFMNNSNSDKNVLCNSFIYSETGTAEQQAMKWAENLAKGKYFSLKNVDTGEILR